ncbi:MAG: PhzF family phenazine biosynthesis protein [Gammaproteobacteria bacterium]|nr:PhzF family phenazine biosynthesis protein [Gammaproteobacteria bacterium]
MKLTIVDVFAETLYAGNQLAVVEDCAHLDDATMQDIAREMNFSETTFVTARHDGRATVRIFTPTTELPFAGHPTLGTAWVLAGGEGEYTLDLGVGPVRVTFADGLGWMEPPDVRFDGTFEPDKAAELVGLDVADLDPDYPLQFAQVGPKFILIGVKTLDALRRASLNGDLHADYLASGIGVQCVFVFSSDSYGEDADYAARMFFHAGSVREDPATGSANSAFAAYLKNLFGMGRTYVVDQGVEMQRASRLYLEIGETNRVGGKVQPVAQGQFS